MNRRAIQERPVAASRGEQLFERRIVDYADLRHFVHVESYGNAGVRHPVDEVHRPVDRVDYPRRRVCELDFLAALRYRLLADESVRKFEDEFFGSFGICFGFTIVKY